MKDDLKEAMGDLEKEAREFCKEKDLDPEKTEFTMRILKNLVNATHARRITGIDELIKSLNGSLEWSRCEAMMFIIDDDPGLSSQERSEGEKYIREKKLMNEEEHHTIFITEAKATLERVKNDLPNDKIVFARILEADAHVRVGLFNCQDVKFFCLI